MDDERLTNVELPAPARAHPSQRGNARDRILDAAASVAHLIGPGHLSLDAVAEQAGVSKGGLLYHFPTKQALISALIERYLAAAEVAAGITGTDLPTDGNRLAIGLLRACCPPQKKKGAGWAFLAAIAENPSLLEPIRQHHRHVVERLRAAASPDVALIAFLVVEGIRSLDLFDSNPLSDLESTALLERLNSVLQTGGVTAPSGESAEE